MDQAGWRWVTNPEEELGWRADIWVGGSQRSAPCSYLGPNDDPRQCTEVEAFSDRTYFPSKLRLDLRPEHLCERSVWRDTYREVKIEIGTDASDIAELANCDPETWRNQPDRCDAREMEITDEWSVQYVNRTIEVPAGVFPGCLCVRRRTIAIDGAIPSDMRDTTYCFARDVGKIYELERPGHVECLVEYRVNADTRYSSSSDVCDQTQVEP